MHPPLPSSSAWQKKAWYLLAAFSLLKLAIHLISSRRYGFHRDELLHLSCSEHLAWGYMEFPPFIAFAGWLERCLFGDSLQAARILPALVGVALVWLAGLMAREMKGKLLATGLAAAGILGAYAYYRNHTLFQPVAFDQLFWTLGFYWSLRYLNTGHSRYLILLGATAGLGLLNKYTMVFWGAGLFLGLLASPQRSLLRQPQLWLAVGLAAIILLPNVIWQYRNGFPLIEHFSALQERHFDGSRGSFLYAQFRAMNPWSFLLWTGGCAFLLLAPKTRPYKVIGWAYLAMLALFLLAKGKPYYLFGAYPVLFAAGGVALEHYLAPRWRWVGWFWVALLLMTGLRRSPFGTPLLPIGQFAAYAGLEKNEEGRLEGLAGDYADMFGWPEQVALVDSLYRSLTPVERERCVIWAENYGEAAAVKILGKAYGLPNPVCKHGSFWLWGPGEKDGEIAISLGNEEEDVQFFFEDARLVKMIQHPYAIGEEHNIPVYLCRKPRITLKEYWPEWRDNVFD